MAVMISSLILSNAQSTISLSTSSISCSFYFHVHFLLSVAYCDAVSARPLWFEYYTYRESYSTTGLFICKFWCSAWFAVWFPPCFCRGSLSLLWYRSEYRKNYCKFWNSLVLSTCRALHYVSESHQERIGHHQRHKEPHRAAPGTFNYCACFTLPQICCKFASPNCKLEFEKFVKLQNFIFPFDVETYHITLSISTLRIIQTLFEEPGFLFKF